MNAPSPHPAPASDRPREIDVQLVEALMRLYDEHPPEPVQALLAQASRITGEGHVYLDLTLADPAAVNALDTFPALVGTGVGNTPFVREGNRLYLRRFWQYEQQVAARLMHLAQAPAVRDVNDWQAAIAATGLSAEQQTALRKALENRLTIITGGPGTGKTTVAAHCLRLLAAIRPAEPLRVRTAAPTGKAAARIDESLHEQLGEANRIPEPAATIERLLGFQRGSPYFVHNRENPLAADVVLIDETSMIDLPKMAKLLEAISEHTQLILLGDKDQLASVEPGSVLAELCQAVPLQPCVATLTQSHRFPPESPVARLSRAVNRGAAAEAWQQAQASAQSDAGRVVTRNGLGFNATNPPPAFSAAVREGFQPFLDATDAPAAFAALRRFRVLCALRRGPQGVERINRAIEDLLLPDRQGVFYDHRVILITRNHPDLNLYNGDVGIVLATPSRAPCACFETAANAFRTVPCGLLPDHETAFAMTVHKAQGSGFGQVVLVLPDQDSPVLTRELIYTAITRAEMGVEMWCTEAAFKAGVNRPTQRNMGLKDRLATWPSNEAVRDTRWD
ncbi:MAG: exodeoxyribonuclease V subunit alpha [Candidatus Marinimicrobia bacterium]|nr:exodeoxyribonuclease V subunit alpha [Candidatus Neomarinimicrobiota bacterium]